MSEPDKSDCAPKCVVSILAYSKVARIQKRQAKGATKQRRQLRSDEDTSKRGKSSGKTNRMSGGKSTDDTYSGTVMLVLLGEGYHNSTIAIASVVVLMVAYAII